ncbi:hypothetical protein N752_16005 [Desulforamulus aquiferis]|nr:hypothetical protein N752_16005 [Desulforamulus aquiferis]
MLRRIGGGLLKALKFLFKNKNFQRYIAAGLFFVLITMLVAFEFVPQKVNLQVGQISPSTIFAPRSVVYVDQEKTTEERQKAMERVPRLPEVNRDVPINVQQDINQVLDSVKKVQADTEADEDIKTNRVKALIPFSLSDQIIRDIAEGNPASTDQLAEV